MLRKHQEKTFPARTDELVSIRKLVELFFQPTANSSDSTVIHDLIYAIDEACANIIGHGYTPGDDRNDITITLNEYTDNFEVMVKDNAPRFNPLNAKMPDLARHSRSHVTSGLGIYMMKKLADEITYEPASISRGNKLTFIQYKCAEYCEQQAPTH